MISNCYQSIEKHRLAPFVLSWSKTRGLALGIIQRACLIEKGRIRYEGQSADLMENKETRLKYPGVCKKFPGGFWWRMRA